MQRIRRRWCCNTEPAGTKTQISACAKRANLRKRAIPVYGRMNGRDLGSERARKSKRQRLEVTVSFERRDKSVRVDAVGRQRCTASLLLHASLTPTLHPLRHISGIRGRPQSVRPSEARRCHQTWMRRLMVNVWRQGHRLHAVTSAGSVHTTSLTFRPTVHTWPVVHCSPPMICLIAVSDRSGHVPTTHFVCPPRRPHAKWCRMNKNS